MNYPDAATRNQANQEAINAGKIYADGDNTDSSSGPRLNPNSFNSAYYGADPYQGNIGAVVPTSWDNVYVDALARGPNMNYGLVRGMATDVIPDDELKRRYVLLPPAIKGYLEQAAKAQGGSSGKAFFDRLVDASQEYASYGIYKDPITIFWEDVQTGVYDLPGVTTTRGGGGGYYGGGGGGGGTSTTTVYTNKEDARVLIDQLSLELIGRTVNNKEFDRLYGTLRAAEQANPTVVTSDGVNTVQEQGLGSAGRQEVLMDELRKDDNFADYQVESQMVNMFTSYLDERGVFSSGL